MATPSQNLAARIAVVCAEIAAITSSEDFTYKESLYKELAFLREQLALATAADSDSGQQTTSITLI